MLQAQLWLEAVVHVLAIRVANESDDVTYSLGMQHASAVDPMGQQRAPLLTPNPPPLARSGQPQRGLNDLH